MSLGNLVLSFEGQIWFQTEHKTFLNKWNYKSTCLLSNSGFTTNFFLPFSLAHPVKRGIRKGKNADAALNGWKPPPIFGLFEKQSLQTGFIHPPLSPLFNDFVSDSYLSSLLNNILFFWMWVLTFSKRNMTVLKPVSHQSCVQRFFFVSFCLIETKSQQSPPLSLTHTHRRSSHYVLLSCNGRRERERVCVCERERERCVWYIVH